MSKTINRIAKKLKVISKENNRVLKDPSDLDFSQTELYFNVPEWTQPCAYIEGNADEDDAISINSFSTTATTDDNPGPGRLLDKYIYQRFGRKIERLASRFTIASLPPAQISQFFESRFNNHGIGFGWVGYMSDIIPDICEDSGSFVDTTESTFIAGLKSLVRQTQSKSCYRSAAALTALIRVSLTQMLFGAFFASVANIEPILHLEIIADTLDYENPEKKYFYFLTLIARANATLHVVRLTTVEIALALREFLKQVLISYREGAYDPLMVVGDATFLFAQAVSCIRIGGVSDAHKHIIDTLYFLSIFFIRSIPELHTQAKDCDFMIRQHNHQALSTLIYWLDSVLYRCIWCAQGQTMFDKSILEKASALRALMHADDFMTRLLPRSSQFTELFPLVKYDVLPRNVRGGVYDAKEKNDPAIVRRLISFSTRRLRRLLTSFDELEKDVNHEPAQLNPSTPHDHHDDREKGASRASLEKARRVHVREDDLTAEFRSARQPVYHNGVELSENWEKYRGNRLLRRKWGEYFRSDLDWDWGLATCLVDLFTTADKAQVRTGSVPPKERAPVRSSAGVGRVHDGILNVAIDMSPESVTQFHRVQIVYRSTTGEIKYQTFQASPLIEDNTIPVVSKEDTLDDGVDGMVDVDIDINLDTISVCSLD